MENVAEKSTVNVNRLRSFRFGISKTMNNISQAIMNEILELRKTNRAIWNQYKLHQEVPIVNQITFRSKSIRYLVPKIHFHFTWLVSLKLGLIDSNKNVTYFPTLNKFTLNYILSCLIC